MERIAAGSHVVVVGAGIVGVTAALALRRRGYEVSVLTSAEPGAEEAASYGNAGWLNPGSVVPHSMPGMWKKVPGYLLDTHGPLRIRLAAVPQAWSWLLRFVTCGATEARVRRIARALRPFLSDSLDRHAALAAEAGVAELIEGKGLLVVYPDEQAFAGDALGWELRRANGVRWKTLDRAGLLALCPGLGENYRYGALIEGGGHCTDPGAYVAALGLHAVRQGVHFLTARADGFVVKHGVLHGVSHAGGILRCEKAVIAAGIATRELAALLGDPIPLFSERGYHVQVHTTDQAPSVPLMMSDMKFGITPMRAGVRAAGQVEFAPKGAPPDWQRARILLDCLRRGLPGMTIAHGDGVRRWWGNRPSTPDCLPVIGPSPSVKGVFYATGHGHLGLVSAPWTAELVGRMADGETVEEAAAYAPSRFGKFRL
ncbi:NAD(P)/FAD-dependent oxidoreductase [Acetobacter garciniae]|uniref:FAD-dependent oxidoreductase n=1 Tax=Acetobacter garciniae TaxID=2817435 RepID=A0A939HJX3_9PROT|nr:FAD-dependent oxidoreductase [Acetobacter garciniae]